MLLSLSADSDTNRGRNELGAGTDREQAPNEEQLKPQPLFFAAPVGSVFTSA